MTAITPLWQPPPQDLGLHGRDLHIWRAVLEPSSPECVKAFHGLLSGDERKRAGRFRFERHRIRFTVCRGTLRKILGGYLNIPPAQVSFAYGTNGKPVLSAPSDRIGLCFNLAHSHRLALFAFAHGRSLGIDVEYQREMPRAEDLAQRFFSPQESKRIMEMPADQRQEGFYRCWTRKEAYIKAIGAGFSFPLDRFSVSLGADEPARLTRVAGAPQEASAWSMMAMIPREGYLAALVAQGSGGRCRWWEAGRCEETAPEL